jgi:hypothetical protein
MPWELLPLAFSFGAAVGGVVGFSMGRDRAADTMRTAARDPYWEKLAAGEYTTGHDHKH